MKKWIWIPIIVVLLILFGCQKEQRTGTEDPSGSIETMSPIAGQIEGRFTASLEHFEQGDASAGVLELLDVVVLTRPADSFPEGFLDAIDEARMDFQVENYKDGVSEVAQARRLFESSLKIRLPLETGETHVTEKSEGKAQVAPISALIKEHLESAREVFMAGDADRGVIKILEAIELLAPKPPIQE